MFWGLIMEPNRRYSQTVERSFHVSMASLDSSTADDQIVQVMLYYEDLNYLLCSLQKGQTWQVPLDLNFEEGTKIAFTSNGRGHVHLTGYLVPEEQELDLDDMEEASDEEDDEEEIPQLVGAQPKRKAQDSPKDSKSAKRTKAALLEEDSSDEDEESDDEEIPKMNGAAKEEDDSEDEDEEDEDSSEEEDEEEEEEIKAKPQSKKQKKEQQQQQQQLSKKEKQKLANGKEAKQEPAAASQQQKKGKAEPQQQQKKTKGEIQQQQQAQKKRQIEGGVQVEDVKVGSGAPAKSGKFVSVYYVGKLTNGKKFDSTTQGEGFKFRLGKGEVIKGWDVGIAGMKIGGKRRITIPPGMAYGAKGSPPVIPGNSTLVFEVELKNVH